MPRNSTFVWCENATWNRLLAWVLALLHRRFALMYFSNRLEERKRKNLESPRVPVSLIFQGYWTSWLVIMSHRYPATCISRGKRRTLFAPLRCFDQRNLRRASLIRDKLVAAANWHQLNISLRVTRVAFHERKLNSKLLNILFWRERYFLNCKNNSRNSNLISGLCGNVFAYSGNGF